MSDHRQRHGPEGNQSQSHRSKQVTNIKPKPNQKESHSRDEQHRKEKPAKVRRSRSSDSDRVERGRRRDTERHDGERRYRGRSEETRRHDRSESERSKVKPPEDDIGDTECAVCFCSYDNVFKTPKLLACGHTFCLECLARINTTSPELKTLSCPICRELTKLPHGRDLPHLGNNQDIIEKLPPGMHRALSIRFKRSKGKLLLKNPPPTSPTKTNILTLPVKTQEAQVAARAQLSNMEEGNIPTTVVNVGRPPNRVRGGLRRMFRSDQCYYTAVGTVIAITVALLLVGLLAFVIIPRMAVYQRPVRPVNQTDHNEGRFTYGTDP